MGAGAIPPGEKRLGREIDQLPLSIAELRTRGAILRLTHMPSENTHGNNPIPLS